MCHTQDQGFDWCGCEGTITLNSGSWMCSRMLLMPTVLSICIPVRVTLHAGA